MRSWLVLLMLGFASAVRAQHEPPEDEPVETLSYMGVLAGGSGYFQVAGRGHLIGPLLIEGGILAFSLSGFVGNGSVGLSLEHTQRYVSPFASLGTGFGVLVAYDSREDREDESQARATGSAFGYARLGLNISFDHYRDVMFSVDGGCWYGVIGEEGRRNRTFLWPMLGLGAYIRVPIR